MAFLLDEALRIANEAIKADSDSKLETAKLYYIEAATAIMNVNDINPVSQDVIDKARKYFERAMEIKEILKNMPSNSVEKESNDTIQYKRAEYLLGQAVTADEENNMTEALELYKTAIEFLFEIKNNLQDESLRERIGKLCVTALDRAEYIKANPEKASNRKASSQPSPVNQRRPKLSPFKNLTQEDLVVLKSTSKINNQDFVPFIEELDSRERFAFASPFSDKDGLLALSEQQRKSFSRWVRPSDYVKDPKMIILVSCYSIKQTLVTDCSFVASMAIAAQYERRFNKRLITNIIYPQLANGEPVYNPCGKYMVKLHLNGIPRKVIIDDLLPMGRNDELLCSFSTNRNELWVSLLEKAYLKVMGGYDFPGSNSNIDLYALTGWIPERISISDKDQYFAKDYEFKRILQKFHQGDCLVTVATGPIRKEEADRAGLVPTHAYAMLDIREVDGHRLFLLKNPWSHMRWRGNFSDTDTRNWTPSLMKKLNFDLSTAKMVDNGIFWIDYDSICHYFDVFCLNWNPSIFQYSNVVHGFWNAEEGPKKDIYSRSNNPQFSVKVKSDRPYTVWALLSRHITEKKDFANNKEFIGLVTYKNVESRKIFYANSPSAYQDSPRINSPHVLVKLNNEKPIQDKNITDYIFMVSLYEKVNTIKYSLTILSTAPFIMDRIVDPFKFSKEIYGNWRAGAAGGCSNNPSYQQNPKYILKVPNPTGIINFELRGPKEYSIGISLENKVTHEKKDSDSYHYGYTMMELNGLPDGEYIVMLSTYRPDQHGPFILNVKSTKGFTLTEM